MITVFVIMTAGMVVGFLVHNRTEIVKISNKLTSWSIYLLLFLLGIGVGLNDKIINNIHIIGLQAITITAGALIGSLIFAYITYKLFFVGRK